jgi:SAM-dependent methyltransferase
MKNYNKLYSNTYDIFNKDKKYKEEAKFVDKIIQKYKKNSKTILELGTGTGSHAIFLAKKYNYTGVEKSGEMIKICEEKKIKAKIFKQDIRNLKLNKKYDIIVALFCVVVYLTNINEFIKTLKNVYKHLNKGGLFIFDFWYTPAVNSIKPQITHNIKKKDNNTYERIATPKIVNSKRIDVVYKFNLNLGKKMYKSREIHKVRHFRLSDIEKYYEKSYLKPIHYCEMTTKKKPSNMTWKILTVLKK